MRPELVTPIAKDSQVEAARVPPQSIDAEQSVLGGLLLDNNAWDVVTGLVTALDFYRTDHRLIFQHIGSLIDQGKPADPLTVAESLERAGKLAEIGGQSYLGSLSLNTPSAANIRRYAEIVAERAMLRRAASIGMELADRAYAGAGDIDELRDTARIQLDAMQVPGRQVSYLDLRALANKEPELPHFPIPDWAPAGYAVGLFGHGGTGKSTLALLLAVCLASGRDFAGVPVERRRVMYFACEDREGVLHWRLTRICRYLGISLDDLADWLNIMEMVAHDCVLWRRDLRDNTTPETAVYRGLAARMRMTRSQVLILDGIFDVFAGNANDPADVKQFVNSAVALVPPKTGFALLLGHVSKVTAGNNATSEGYLGTTQWHNAVRARWFLRSETAENGDGPKRTGRLLLELQKSNLGPTEQTIAWRWDNDAHLFLPEAAPTAFDRTRQERDELNGIRLALQACAASKIDVPAATTGPRTAYHVLAAQPALPETLRSSTSGARRFRALIEKLRVMGHVCEESKPRKDRHQVRCLALTPEGTRVCGQC